MIGDNTHKQMGASTLASDTSLNTRERAAMPDELPLLMTTESQATKNVFLSYARKDIDFARSLHDRLETAMVVVWWDQEEMPGQDWTEQLLVWLEDADAVVVVVSQYSVKSLSVKNEILLAQDYQRHIIPVLLEQARGGLWVLIRSLQWVDARDGIDPLPELLRVLQQHDHQPDQHAPIQDLLTTGPNMDQQFSPPPTSASQAQVTVVLPGDVRDFTSHEQQGLQHILARFANIDPEQIRIVRIEVGSIRVTLEMPESIARWLMTLYEHRVPLIDLLDIEDVRDLQVLPISYNRPAGRVQLAAASVSSAPPVSPAPPTQRPADQRDTASVFERLVDWLRQGAHPLVPRVVGVGALVVLLMAVVLNVFVADQLPTVVGNTQLVGIVADVQGDLAVQRKGWSEAVPVLPGTALQNGDQLVLDSGSRATVVCADKTLVAVPQEGGSLCNVADNTFLFVSSVGSAVLPMMTPRSTMFLTPMPLLRWDTRGDTSTVAVRQGAEVIWSTTVTNVTTLVYPDNAPPLQRGQTYQLVVTADDSVVEAAVRADFTILTETKMEQVEAEVQQVRDLGLDETTTQFLIANVYATYNLNVEALALLEDRDSVTPQPAMLQLQGDLYASIGLIDRAIATYEQALTTAQQADDQLGQALAHQALGEISIALSDTNDVLSEEEQPRDEADGVLSEEQRERASDHIRQAIQIYQTFGDDQMVTTLQQRLNDIAGEG